MEEDADDLTPFWLQSSANLRRRRRSFFLSSGVLVFLLCATAIIFIFFIIPSVLSLTSQIFRPNLVKKSWDSLNVVLVLFALVFGFLSRNVNRDTSFDEDHQTVSNSRTEVQKSNPSTPHQWYEYSDRTVYSSSATGGLRRTYSSYPDLREVSPWDTTDDRRRFSDDTRVDAYRSSDSDQLHRRRSWKRVVEEDEGSDRSKTIRVDTFVNRPKEVSYTPAPLSSPPPSPLPPQSPPRPAVKRKPRQTYESIAHKEERNEQVRNDPEPTKSLTSPTIPPPPPPPSIFSEKKSNKSDRKRGGANATKDFLTSLYHQSKKKKKQRQRSVDNFETLLQPQAAPLHSLPPPSPPPPPPPPPPPSVLHNLFSSKKGKSKKFISIPPPPPPPPPPVTAASASKSRAQISPITARIPPLPVKINTFNSVEENSNSGGESPLTGCESPLIPIPPPPPPPPFKMPSWKFVVQGDYVKIGSMNSSRSGSPDLDDPESPMSSESGETTIAVEVGGDAAAPLFCPSPDVDSKADMFIARFRAGLKLQKINSMKQKQGLGLSNLGPETKPGPGPNQI